MSKVKKSWFTEEQIAGILREGEKPDRTVVEVCCQRGIAEHTYYGGGTDLGQWNRRRSNGCGVLGRERPVEVAGSRARPGD